MPTCHSKAVHEAKVKSTLNAPHHHSWTVEAPRTCIVPMRPVLFCKCGCSDTRHGLAAGLAGLARSLHKPDRQANQNPHTTFSFSSNPPLPPKSIIILLLSYYLLRQGFRLHLLLLLLLVLCCVSLLPSDLFPPARQLRQF